MAGLKNVLLVEDEPMIRDLYRIALADSGYTVEVADNADEAFTKLGKFQPDCIFLDVMLPGTSGLEILTELRSNPAHGCMDAKIVILTNLAQRSVADNAMEHGADGYVIKADIFPRDLPKVIKSLEEE
ncbi:MAG: Response regulator receiver protein [Candidatus Saccharibacteria bacterium]|nr:Response regulator receiver protein [Candidatus Saccharibacteria bacterium]